MVNELKISNRIFVSENEINIDAVRAQGSGGQNVNKVSTAIHLRFDIKGSGLPETVKEDLLKLSDSRITKNGVIVIKAKKFRTQEKNREDALERLKEIIGSVLIKPGKRKPTRPSKNAKKRRMDDKAKHSQRKKLRGKVRYD